MTRERDFWTRRREAVRAEAEAEEAAARSLAEAERAARLDENSDQEILEKLELPDPDELKAGDDFSMFMNKAVPDRLRRRALRKLWLSNPLLANVDGLVDYGEDFTDRALAVENLQTAYQVGKGMLKHVAEVDQRDAGEDDADDVAEVAPTATPEPLASTVRVPEVAAQDHDHPVEGQGGEAIEIAEALPQPRRMQFTFEGDAA